MVPYGAPEDLPNIYHQREYAAGLTELPDYRLTCLFVDKDYRREGVSAAALRGALNQIAEAGGGVVEAYPQDNEGKKARRRFSTTAREVSSNRPASSTSDPRARTTVSSVRGSRRADPEEALSRPAKQIHVWAKDGQLVAETVVESGAPMTPRVLS